VRRYRIQEPSLMMTTMSRILHHSVLCCPQNQRQGRNGGLDMQRMFNMGYLLRYVGQRGNGGGEWALGNGSTRILSLFLSRNRARAASSHSFWCVPHPYSTLSSTLRLLMLRCRWQYYLVSACFLRLLDGFTLRPSSAGLGKAAKGLSSSHNPSGAASLLQFGSVEQPSSFLHEAFA
jgi:hypothetical protein